MTQKDSPGRRGDLTLAGFLASALAAVVFAGGTYWLSLQQARAQDWISHTHQVLAAIAGTRADLVDLQNGPRGYILSGDEAELQPYDDARASIALDVARLRDLTAGNPVQQRDVQAFEEQLGPRLATAAAMIEARRAGGLPAAAAVMDSPPARQQMPALRQVLQRMEAEESRQLARRWDEHQERLRAFWLAMAALLATLFTTLALLYQQVRRKQAAQRSALEGEQQFHLMTDSVTEYAILKLDPEGRVRTWNPGAQRIHGWREADILGHDFACFYTGQDQRCGTPPQALAAAVAQGRFTTEAWRVRQDGSRFWASVAITPLRQADGRLTGFCKITRDLSEAKAAEDLLRAEMLERARIGEELSSLNARLEALVHCRTLELQQSNEALRAATERLQALSARLISAQEEERRHIARELHDETGQALTLIRMQLADLANAHPGTQRAVADCTQHVDRAISHIRGLSLRLRPPMLDDLGLSDALEWVVEQQSRAAGWQADIDVEDVHERLPENVETACFRICQEALTNAARYARATQVRVSLHQSDDALELVVADNGAGFDLERYRTPEERKKHFGLVSMSERASLAGGRLDIATAPGAGTRIRVLFEGHRRGGNAPARAEHALPA